MKKEYLYQRLVKRPYSFQKITGISPKQFQELAKKVSGSWYYRQKKKTVSGRPFAIGNLKEHILLLLLYYRNYTSQEFLGTWFRADAGTICRSIKRIEPLVKKVVDVKKKQKILEEELETILIDCTEQAIQRPTKSQRIYYSGKKKRHTIKTEIWMNKKGKILHVSDPYPGSQHDFSIHENQPPLPPKSRILADSGYQGLQKKHKKVVLPIKKKGPDRPLPRSAVLRNRAHSRERIPIECKIGFLKRFRILFNSFRNPLPTYAMKMGIIAGIVNMQCGF